MGGDLSAYPVNLPQQHLKGQNRPHVVIAVGVVRDGGRRCVNTGRAVSGVEFGGGTELLCRHTGERAGSLWRELLYIGGKFRKPMDKFFHILCIIPMIGYDKTGHAQSQGTIGARPEAQMDVC